MTQIVKAIKYKFVNYQRERKNNASNIDSKDKNNKQK